MMADNFSNFLLRSGWSDLFAGWLVVMRFQGKVLPIKLAWKNISVTNLVQQKHLTGDEVMTDNSKTSN